MAYQLPPFGYRPYNTFLNALTDVYVDPTGDDRNPGTPAQPVQTWRGAQARIAEAPAGIVNVHWANGSYALPPVLAGISYQNHTGNLINQLDGTVTTVIVADDEEGVIVDVAGPAVAADDLRGHVINYPNSGNRIGVCYRNDVTALGVTRIYLTQSPLLSNLNGPVVAPIPGDVIQLFQLGATFTMAAETAILAGTSSSFTNIAWTGPATTRTLYLLATDKPNFVGCTFSSMRQVRTGTAGRAHLDACYIATTGLDSAGGMLAASNGGTLLLQRGTVVDGVNAIAGTTNYIAAMQGGSLAFRNLCAFRGLEDAIRIVGARLLVDGTLGAEDGIFFENASGAGASNAGSALAVDRTEAFATGLGSQCVAPNFHGEVTGAHAVVTNSDAVVLCGMTSTLITSTVPMAVSADDGATTTAWNFRGGAIYGGVPARPPRRAEVSGPVAVAGPYTASAGDFLSIDPSSGTVVIDMPLTADIVVGDNIIMANTTNSAVAFTVDGNGNNVAEVQVAPGTYAATTTLQNPGLVVTYAWNGTNWVGY